jgi:hypothetical protein
LLEDRNEGGIPGNAYTSNPATAKIHVVNGRERHVPALGHHDPGPPAHGLWNPQLCQCRVMRHVGDMAFHVRQRSKQTLLFSGPQRDANRPRRPNTERNKASFSSLLNGGSATALETVRSKRSDAEAGRLLSLRG